MNFRQRLGGFTLIEVLVTLTIVALLARIALPVAQLERQRVREQQLESVLRQIRTAIDAYKRAYDSGRIIHSVGASGYPPTIEVLVAGVEDASDPEKKKMYFLRHVPRDPMAPADVGADVETWAMRCYASEPLSPQAGDDVFDVHSRSTRVGLNGIAYSNW